MVRIRKFHNSDDIHEIECREVSIEGAARIMQLEPVDVEWAIESEGCCSVEDGDYTWIAD